MSQTASAWLVLLVALAAANLPFLNDRLGGLIALKSGSKPLAFRFAELGVLSAMVGGVGWMLEYRAGQIAPQGWEFYAVTGALFVVLAFPGFVYRYMIRHRY